MRKFLLFIFLTLVTSFAKETDSPFQIPSKWFTTEDEEVGSPDLSSHYYTVSLKQEDSKHSLDCCLKVFCCFPLGWIFQGESDSDEAPEQEYLYLKTGNLQFKTLH